MVMSHAETLAAAKAIGASSGGDIMTVGCRATANDGYFGHFVHDASDSVSTFPSDGLGFVDAMNRRWKRLYDDVKNARWFGVRNDDVAADTALSDALNSGGKLIVPRGTYRVTTPIVVASSVEIVGCGPTRTIFKPDLGIAGGGATAFSMLANHITVRDLGVVGTGITMSPITSSRHAFVSGSGSVFAHHRYKNIGFTDWSYTDGKIVYDNKAVAHCIYAQWMDDVLVEDCYLDRCTGAFFIAKNSTDISVQRNQIKSAGWYPVHLRTDVVGFDVGHNHIDMSGLPSGAMWGAGVDLMSNEGANNGPIKEGAIHDNRFSGYFAYGAVIRIASAENVHCFRNRFRDLKIGSWVVGIGTLSVIRVVTRGTDEFGFMPPCGDVHIYENDIDAPEATDPAGNYVGIYASNDWHTVRDPLRGLWINRNEVRSIDEAHYFDNAVIVHGVRGGIEDVWIEDNLLISKTRAGSIGSGALAIAAFDDAGRVMKVRVGGNTLRDIGTPINTANLAIGIGAGVDDIVFTKPNIIENYFDGVRMLAATAPNTAGANIYGQYDQVFKNMNPAGKLVRVNSGSYADRSDLIATEAELLDRFSVINTSGLKRAGLMVLLSEPPFQVAIASGPTNIAPWYQSSGNQLGVTPAIASESKVTTESPRVVMASKQAAADLKSSVPDAELASVTPKATIR